MSEVGADFLGAFAIVERGDRILFVGNERTIRGVPPDSSSPTSTTSRTSPSPDSPAVRRPSSAITAAGVVQEPPTSSATYGRPLFAPWISTRSAAPPAAGVSVTVPVTSVPPCA